MAIINRKWGRTSEGQEVYTEQPATHQGRVLEIQRSTYHVPSDNAMIDSGERSDAKVWQDGRVDWVNLTHGRGGDWATADVDADETTQQMAREYEAFVNWMKSLRAAIYNHNKAVAEGQKIVRGCRVRVVRGRKVKKGTEWFVHTMGNGDYGPYVHLAQNMNGVGEFVRYVNPENLERIDSPKITLEMPKSPYGPVTANVQAIALEMARHNNLANVYDQATLDGEWRILHDAWEEEIGTPPACLWRAAFRDSEHMPF